MKRLCLPQGACLGWPEFLSFQLSPFVLVRDRACLPQGACLGWPEFLTFQLSPFVLVRDRARLASVSHAFHKDFRNADGQKEDLSPSRNFEDLTTILLNKKDLLAYEHWEAAMRTIRDLSFSQSRKIPPELWDAMPVLQSLHKLTAPRQDWFPTLACPEKMPNLTELVFDIWHTPELDLRGFTKLKRLTLDTEDVLARKVYVDLAQGVCNLAIDANFVIRTGSETIEQLTLTTQRRGKHVCLEAPRWPALTSLSVMSPMFDLTVTRGFLPLREFAFPRTYGPAKRDDLAEICSLNQLKTLFLAHEHVNDISSFPSERLIGLEELTVHYPGKTKSNDLKPLVAVAKTLKRLVLVIEDNPFDNNGGRCQVDMRSVGLLTQLESLRLEGHYLSYAALSCLASCQELRHLFLHGMAFDQVPRDFHFSLPRLETLDLAVHRLQSFFNVATMLTGLTSTLRRLTLACFESATIRGTDLCRTLRLFQRLDWLDLHAIRCEQRSAILRSPARATELDNWFSPTCTIVP